MRQRESTERRYAEFFRLFVSDFRDDIPMYLDLAAKYPGPVLDVGCGTGRVSAHLAAARHIVCGIDISTPMLEVAKRQLVPWQAHTQVRNFDLRHEPLSERFAVALITGHMFNHLIDVEEQRLFLRHLRASMSSPGIAAFDLFCPVSLIQPQNEASQWRTIERCVDGQHLVVRDQREMLTPLLERRVQVFCPQGDSEIEKVTHRRYTLPGQLAALLLEAEFEGIRWTSGYDLAGARSPEDGMGPAGPFQVIAEV